MEWTRLIDLPDENITPGCIFRFHPGDMYMEEVIDVILCSPVRENFSFEMYVISGYNAGSWFAGIESDTSTNTRVLSKAWMLENWNMKIFPWCDVAEIYIGNPPAPLTLP